MPAELRIQTVSEYPARIGSWLTCPAQLFNTTADTTVILIATTICDLSGWSCSSSWCNKRRDFGDIIYLLPKKELKENTATRAKTAPAATRAAAAAAETGWAATTAAAAATEWAAVSVTGQ